MKGARTCGFVAAFIAGLLLAAASAPVHAQQAAKPATTAIQILKVESDEVKLPPEFQMALYENLIEEVRKTGRFQQVYRDGDRGAEKAADLVILHSTVRGFKEGSARARQVTTVAGATSIKVHVQIADRLGRTRLARDVEGKVRFFGENLRATYDFAKRVAKLVPESM